MEKEPNLPEKPEQVVKSEEQIREEFEHEFRGLLDDLNDKTREVGGRDAFMELWELFNSFARYLEQEYTGPEMKRYLAYHIILGSSVPAKLLDLEGDDSIASVLEMIDSEDKLPNAIQKEIDDYESKMRDEDKGEGSE